MDINKRGVAKELLNGDIVVCKSCGVGTYESANNISVEKETIFRCKNCGDTITLVKRLKLTL